MAYAAVISLQQTIQRLLKSSQISILPPSRQIIEFSYKEARSLEEIIGRFESTSSQSVSALTEEIRQAVYKLEDALESHVSNQFLSQSKSLEDEACSPILHLDVEEIRQEIDSFSETVKKMEECSKQDQLELSNPLPEEDDAIPSTTDFIGKNSNIVGLSKERRQIRQLITDWRSYELRTYSLVGMAGIGKSTLAEEVYEDVLISHRFKRRAWVTVGPKYNFKKILLCLLRQMDYDIEKIQVEEDGKLVDYLRTSLEGQRYLIILDDVWNKEDWDEVKCLFPDDHNGSRVLLTTRVEEVAQHADAGGVHHIRFLDKEESWYLLREKVFGDQYSCPPQLERPGKKIAEKCQGLPLAIITVARLLSKAEKTFEFWVKVAEGKTKVFTAAYDEMSKVLFPSYKYLPQYLKACFLYIGVFPPDSEIPASKLIKLWSAEGLLKENPSKTLEDFSMECLAELISRSIVLVSQPTSRSGIKTCKLHSVFWHLCIKVAGKEKFFHVMNSFPGSLTQDIEKQRRLCIHKNILFGIKKVQSTMRSISRAHSILCTGPHHQYPVPISFDLRMLRVLDALAIRLYSFPLEVLKLVHLKYLAITCNGKLPPSICELRKLQYLIVCRHLSIISSGSQSYLPMEIWDMQELKHLQIMGGHLPDPCGAFLRNLLTVSNMSAQSCTKEILERIPNLKKLGIQIELAPDYAAEPLSCFDHLSHLHGLESLKFVILHPKPESQVVSLPASTTVFPSNLRKLSLSGFGYPWEYMRIIAGLPNLEVLKLRCYAFRGPEWVTYDGEFPRLEFLLLEDIDLVKWIAEGYSFPVLQRLIIKHCYKLKEIPLGMAPRTIELVDCASAVASVNRVQEDYGFPQAFVRFSWEEAEKAK